MPSEIAMEHEIIIHVFLLDKRPTLNCWTCGVQLNLFRKYTASPDQILVTSWVFFSDLWGINVVISFQICWYCFFLQGWSFSQFIIEFHVFGRSCSLNYHTNMLNRIILHLLLGFTLDWTPSRMPKVDHLALFTNFTTFLTYY